MWNIYEIKWISPINTFAHSLPNMHILVSRERYCTCIVHTHMPASRSECTSYNESHGCVFVYVNEHEKIFIFWTPFSLEAANTRRFFYPSASTKTKIRDIKMRSSPRICTILAHKIFIYIVFVREISLFLLPLLPARAVARSRTHSVDLMRSVLAHNAPPV